jgi:hypothetical protein
MSQGTPSTTVKKKKRMYKKKDLTSQKRKMSCYLIKNYDCISKKITNCQGLLIANVAFRYLYRKCEKN